MLKTLTQKQKRARAVIRVLKKAYPGARCALNYTNAWELLVATMLSAQCTDKRVNLVTPALFKKFPSIEEYAQARPAEIEELIRSTGFYKNKAKNIQAAACMILEKHGGQIPAGLDALVQIPGVGRKTANVVLGNHFGIPGLTVDTHMIRINRLLGFSDSQDAVKVEFQLMKLIPRQDWVVYTHLIIHHGRVRCVARRPDCANCEIRSLCPRVGLEKV